MVYVAFQFPKCVSFGAQRNPSWRTTVAQVQSGEEFTNQEWSRTRHMFDVSLGVRTSDDYDEVVQHFHTIRGRAKSFPFEDPLDHSATVSRGVVTDDAESPSALYIAKRYGTGAHAYDRLITRPRASTFALFRLRTGVTTNITASATVTAGTGRLTIAGGVYLPGDVLSWSGEFDVPCRYDVDALPTVIVNRRPGEDGPLLVQCDSISIVEVREGP